MNEDLLDYWLRIITPLFPSNAWIAARLSDGDHLILIDWRLENDPRRPSRRSRKIQITIQEKAIDDYLAKNKAGRELSDINMMKWISEKYNQFDPAHDAHAAGSAYTDKWRISMEVLNS